MSTTMPEFKTSEFKDGFDPADDSTKELYNEVAAFAKQGQPIVIFGPTGAGKEFLAHHYYKVYTTTEFYQQYREDWESNYSAIKKEYSKSGFPLFYFTGIENEKQLPLPSPSLSTQILPS